MPLPLVNGAYGTPAAEGKLLTLRAGNWPTVVGSVPVLLSVASPLAAVTALVTEGSVLLATATCRVIGG